MKQCVQNLVKLNEAKCNYMVFTRSKEDFATRLTVNKCKIDQIPVSKILGVWISVDLSWERNTKEICRKAFSRISMLTKLRYVGVSTEDLIEIDILFIRSVNEYCAVAFHSSLTVAQATDIERIQKTSLKVIIGDNWSERSACAALGCWHKRRWPLF